MPYRKQQAAGCAVCGGKPRNSCCSAAALLQLLDAMYYAVIMHFRSPDSAQQHSLVHCTVVIMHLPKV
jgi:hypothetical protein